MSGLDQATDLATLAVGVCAVVVTVIVIGRANEPTAEQPQGNPVLEVVQEWEPFAEGRHRLGPADANVTIVEFGDYSCPYCRDAMPHLEAIMRAYDGEVAFVYRHLPHTDVSLRAAKAAECAAEQGRFWGYHEELYTSSRAWEYGDTDELLTVIAESVGLENLEAFRNCLAADNAVPGLVEDQTLAADSRISATPTFLVNGHMLRGVLDSVRFDELYREVNR